MDFLDLFSGIGGFRLGMEMAGHNCIGHCEIDKYANKAYSKIHEIKKGEWFADDITKIKGSEIPKADVWCFGFPCQDISIAGKQRGLQGTRSGLFHKVIDLIKSQEEKNKPSVLLIENVKNLLSINDGWDFAKVLAELDEAGYDAEWQIINSSWYVPQNRERIFVVGHFRGRCTKKVFPLQGSHGEALKKIVNGAQGNRVYDSAGLACSLQAQSGGQGAKTGLYLINNPISIGFNSNKKNINTAHCLCARDYKGLANQPGNAVEVIPVLTPNRLNKRQNGRRFKEAGEPMFTLTTQDQHGVYIREATKKGYALAVPGDSINLSVPGSKTRRGRVGKEVANTLDTSCNQGTLIEGRIRRLTPLECFRLQGFRDQDYYKAKEGGISDTQLYKCMGNAVTVPVIYEIAKRL